MPLRPCLGWRGQQCTRLTSNGNRCAEHQRAYEQGRRPIPSAAQRGYGTAHQARRAMLLPLAYGTVCPRCGQVMLPGQALDLGHPVGRARAGDPTQVGTQIEHSRCNRSAGNDTIQCA